MPQDPKGDFTYRIRLPPDKTRGDKMSDNDKPWLKESIVISSDIYASQLQVERKANTKEEHIMEQKEVHDELLYNEFLDDAKERKNMGK